jgi:hypothetical protein
LSERGGNGALRTLLGVPSRRRAMMIHHRRTSGEDRTGLLTGTLSEHCHGGIVQARRERVIVVGSTAVRQDTGINRRWRRHLSGSTIFGRWRRHLSGSTIFGRWRRSVRLSLLRLASFHETHEKVRVRIPSGWGRSIVSLLGLGRRLVCRKPRSGRRNAWLRRTRQHGRHRVGLGSAQVRGT